MRVIFLLFLCAIFFAFQSPKDTLLWQEDRPLTWNDFKGKPEPRFAAASTAYDILKAIGKEENKKVTIKIEAVFFKYTSWKKKSWINDEVLAHEQKHFDIVELYARKLRSLITQSGFKDYNDLVNKVNLLYDKMDKEMDAYHDQYDEETDGSMNGDQQRAWNKKITAEIAALDKFKSTTLIVSLP